MTPDILIIVTTHNVATRGLTRLSPGDHGEWILSISEQLASSILPPVNINLGAITLLTLLKIYLRTMYCKHIIVIILYYSFHCRKIHQIIPSPHESNNYYIYKNAISLGWFFVLLYQHRITIFTSLVEWTRCDIILRTCMGCWSEHKR